MYFLISVVPALVTLVGCVLLAMAVFRARRFEAATPIVRIALLISAAWAGIALVGGAVAVIGWFLPNTGVPFEVRTVAYWPVPAPTDGFDIGGGFTVARLMAIDTLSAQARTILAAADLISTLVTVALAGLVAIGCFRFMQGRPFAPDVARLSFIAAIVALAGGIASQMLHQYGGIRALSEIVAAGLGPHGIQAASPFAIDWWPVWLAIGLAALAAIFRYGSRLQRDTEGLV